VVSIGHLDSIGFTGTLRTRARLGWASETVHVTHSFEEFCCKEQSNGEVVVGEVARRRYDYCDPFYR
jgi:hypothetical protein